MSSSAVQKPEAISRCDAILRIWWILLIISILTSLVSTLIGGSNLFNTSVSLSNVAIILAGTPLSRWQERTLKRVRDLDWYVCPRCLYDRRGSDAERCPECGRVGTKDAAKAEWETYTGMPSARVSTADDWIRTSEMRTAEASLRQQAMRRLCTPSWIVLTWQSALIVPWVMMLVVGRFGWLLAVTCYSMGMIAMMAFVALWRRHRTLAELNRVDRFACPRCLQDLRATDAIECPGCGLLCTKEEAKRFWDRSIAEFRALNRGTSA